MHAVHYEPICVDPSGARRGRLHTPHGTVELPTFMPVGTVGGVKCVDVERLEETGAQMVPGNTYHLALRPGPEVVAELGGLHAISGWRGPMLTDSGGFQVFSLADKRKVDEHGVPEFIAGFAQDIEVMIALEPEGRIVNLRFVKTHDQTPPEGIHLTFHPNTMLIRWR